MLYEEASLSCSVLLFSYFISHMTLIVGACVDLDCTYWRFLPLLVLSDVFVTSYLEPFPFASIYLSSNLEVSSYTGQSQVQKCQGISYLLQGLRIQTMDIKVGSDIK